MAVAARRVEELEQVAEEIRACGVDALPIRCDVIDPEQVTGLGAQVSEELGPCDILVNGAGVAEGHKFINHPDEIWHQALAVELAPHRITINAICSGYVDTPMTHRGIEWIWRARSNQKPTPRC